MQQQGARTSDSFLARATNEHLVMNDRPMARQLSDMGVRPEAEDGRVGVEDPCESLVAHDSLHMILTLSRRLRTILHRVQGPGRRLVWHRLALRLALTGEAGHAVVCDAVRRRCSPGMGR